MEQVTATRTELLARRALIALANEGRDLLEDKRDQLMDELRKVVDVVVRGGGALQESATQAREALAVAEALDGPEQVASAALAAGGDITLDATTVTVMGVRIAEIDYLPIGRSRMARGYSLPGSSARIDWAAERFEAELDLVLEIAALEVRVRRLADEIGKTTRRINAIEFAVLPRLQEERDRIQSVLDERERQDRFRLKRIKARRQREL